ncbi:flavin reductase family protein [Celeribacter baekdonensis]|nr:flavin reductase family protein [Celeribacter baekdonensis]
MTDISDMADAFRTAFRNHPAGVAILTATTETGPVAMTVSSLISVSAAPPVIAFSLSNQSATAAALLTAQTVVIHFPRYEDLDLASLCAQPGQARFGADHDWETLPTGEPRYRQIGTWFRGEIQTRLPLEAATLVTAQLLEGACAAATTPHSSETLVYLDRRWRGLGQEGRKTGSPP